MSISSQKRDDLADEDSVTNSSSKMPWVHPDGSYTNPLTAATINPNEIVANPDVGHETTSFSINKIHQNEDEEVAGSPKHPCQFLGFLLILLMNLCIAIVMILVKVLQDKLHPVTQAIWIQMIAFLFAAGVSTYVNQKKRSQKPSPSSHDPDLDLAPKFLEIYLGISSDLQASTQIWTTAFLFGFAIAVKYWCLVYLTIADATTTGYLNIFTGLIFGHFILKDEPLKVIPVLLGLLIVFGVVIIAKPPFLLGGAPLDMTTITGIGLSVLNSLSYGLFFVLQRKFQTIHFSISNCTQTLAAAFMALVTSLTLGVFTYPMGTREMEFLVGMGLVAYLSQILMVLAIKLEKAYLISLYRPTDIVIATGLEMIFLGQNPSWTSILGSSLILICVLVMVFRKIISNQPEGTWSRRWLGFLIY